MFIVNLGLDNTDLYEGCEIETVAGRKNLLTEVHEVPNIVGENIEKILRSVDDKTEVTLTGPMSVLSYLVVFHAVVHKFTRVYYDDGRNGPVLVAAHGR